MKFGVFHEHQLPRPWLVDDEHRAYRSALEQVQLADSLGIDYAWAVEHHYLEEYSHSSAPEVFLAACAARTRTIRLGHGIVLMPPPYNHPARVAERLSALDLLSDGRVEFGTGESSSIMELGGFGIAPATKRAMWTEAVEHCLNMMVMTPYPGFDGQYFSMPCRNVIPKPLQKPHPPVWMACSNRDSILRAARLGLGALTFAFASPDEAKLWVDDYYQTFQRECVPIGHSVNPNIAMVSGFSIHADRDEALRRGEEGFRFFNYALGYYYGFGAHQPGISNVWASFERAGGALPSAGATRGIGTPEDLREHLRAFEAAGVDQMTFIQQSGRNQHDHICEALELFARVVLPEFKERDRRRQANKEERLAPYVEAAMARKQRMAELPGESISVVRAALPTRGAR